MSALLRRSRSAYGYHLMAACRPKQWVKNPLFVMSPLLVVWLNGLWSMESVFGLMALTAVFCLAASSIYLVNDVIDREKDRLHPIKQYRPIAAGWVSVEQALTLSTVLAAGSLIASYLLNPRVALLLATYLVLTHVYSLRMKQIPYVELVLLAALYGLRTLAAFMVVTSSPLAYSGWVVVAMAVALFIGTSKRHTELKVMKGATHTRAVLSHYSLTSLQRLMMASALIMAIAYIASLWQIDRWLMVSGPIVVYGAWQFWKKISLVTEDLHPMQVLLGKDFVMIGGACIAIIAMVGLV